MTPVNHVDLVLEGGGVKGIGLVGAVTTLAAHGYRFDRVAALVGGCEARGVGLGRVEEILRAIDHRRFRDPSLLPRLGSPARALQDLERTGDR